MTARTTRLLRRWGRPAAIAVGVGVVAVIGARLVDLEPDPLRVFLVALLCAALAGLVVGGLQRTGVRWDVVTVPADVHSGRDARLRAHLRVIEDHQRTRQPDALLRDRLAALADEVLTVRHGVRASSPEGRALLGPEAVEVLRGPVTRLTHRRIDQVLRSIEEL